MVKISKIIDIKPFEIISLFDDGEIRVLDVYPLIQKHLHLEGVDKLLETTAFEKAQLGQFGEIFWKNIVKSKDNMFLDYDISPEYFYSNGKKLN
ncbi:MAG: DUF2442 domain-containing protein [Bacteroidetes bacterium]|nr:DUF2442 domain-containing protein [Bacteroidota bacterium]